MKLEWTIIFSVRCKGTKADDNYGVCCTEEKPCDIGEGECYYDNQCKGSLMCGSDNCKELNPELNHFLFEDDDDCCTEKMTKKSG